MELEVVRCMNALTSLLAVLPLTYAAAVSYSTLRTMRGVPLLERLRPPVPVRWPRVSVIIPACNEAETIGAALEARLGEGYPSAEYIVVDDRSTDGTGSIIDAIAAKDPRVVPVHVTHLPDGWLGKLHAMDVGVRRSTGEWILFSDADIHHEPGTLTRVIAHCEKQRLDHLSVFPWIWSSTFWLDVMLSWFLRFVGTATRAWKVGDPSSRVSFGGGIFNLCRRSALERAGGLEPLRLEIADDGALGQLLKWSGARQGVLNARGFVGLHYYRSLPEGIRGLEKNAFAAIRFSLARAIVGMGFLLLVEVGPLVMLAVGDGTLRLAGAVTLGTLALTQALMARWLARPILSALFTPLGAVLMVAATARSTAMTLLRQGVEWRGTRYPLDVLRRGMRMVIA
jgi:hypothetical protein